MSDHPLLIERASQGMTIAKLSAKSGIKPSTISQIENGISPGRPATLIRLAIALGLDKNYFTPKSKAKEIKTVKMPHSVLVKDIDLTCTICKQEIVPYDGIRFGIDPEMPEYLFVICLQCDPIKR